VLVGRLLEEITSERPLLVSMTFDEANGVKVFPVSDKAKKGIPYIVLPYQALKSVKGSVYC
jgi:hypothetical protein